MCHLCWFFLQPPFEENGFASPIEGPRQMAVNGNSITCGCTTNSTTSLRMTQAQSTSLGTSIDSALVSSTTQPNTYPKNRFLSGDLSNREAYIRRQLISIGNDQMQSHARQTCATFQLFAENDQRMSPGEKMQQRASLIMEANTIANNSMFTSFREPLDPTAPTNGFDDVSHNDLDGGKSRKSSGFSDGASSGRQYSGYENKSRNCSGNSISAGLVSSGILNGSAPVMIPGSANMSPQGNSPLAGNDGFQLGLLDLTPSKPKDDRIKDTEINRLREELQGHRNRMASWEEGYFQARNACEAWKKETAMATKKLEVAMKEKDAAISKAMSLQREVDAMAGGPNLHAIKRVSELKTMPLSMLRGLEMQLDKDLQEVKKVMVIKWPMKTLLWPFSLLFQAIRVQAECNQWYSNNRLFDFPPAATNDWSSLINNQNPLYGSLAQQ